MTAPSPLEVVNARMAAYNGHDLDAFLATYHPDVELLAYPDHPLGRGHAHLRMIFDDLFGGRSVHVQILHQEEMAPFVVNHEIVTYPDRAQRYVSIYDVQDGLIVSVRFIRG